MATIITITSSRYQWLHVSPKMIEAMLSSWANSLKTDIVVRRPVYCT